MLVNKAKDWNVFRITIAVGKMVLFTVFLKDSNIDNLILVPIGIRYYYLNYTAANEIPICSAVYGFHLSPKS